MDAATPVLVGIGSVTDRVGGRDALELMAAAIEDAVVDAGSPGLAARSGAIFVPRGTWGHGDPGRWLAARFGSSARSVLADVGVLQTTLIARAVSAIASGAAEVTIVVGGESAATAKRAGQQPAPKPGSAEPGAGPDEVISPHGMVISGLEIARGFWTPAHQYALVERVLDRPVGALDAVWASWSQIAAANPEAWRRESFTPEELACGSPTNPAVAHPYGRRHCSQMYVDQSAALVFVAAGVARSLGIATDRWVFPWAIVESNHMVPLPERADPGRSPGFAAVGEALRRLTGVAPAEADVVDLYSCFPSAVEVQRRELALDADRPLTVTGGMSFAGGPFNNYVLQSTARVARLVREQPGTSGLVTAISGMITKQAGTMWGTEPCVAGGAVEDVSDVVAARTPTVSLVEDADAVAGPARIVSSTVVVAPQGRRTWLLAELATGERTLVSSVDPDVADRFVADAGLGGHVSVRGGAFDPA